MISDGTQNLLLALCSRLLQMGLGDQMGPGDLNPGRGPTFSITANPHDVDFCNCMNHSVCLPLPLLERLTLDQGTVREKVEERVQHTTVEECKYSVGSY